MLLRNYSMYWARILLVAAVCAALFVGWLAIRTPASSYVRCGSIPLEGLSTYTAATLKKIGQNSASRYSACAIWSNDDWDTGQIVVVRFNQADVAQVANQLHWKATKGTCTRGVRAVAMTSKRMPDWYETFTWDGNEPACNSGAGIEEVIGASGTTYYVFVDNNDPIVSEQLSRLPGFESAD